MGMHEYAYSISIVSNILLPLLQLLLLLASIFFYYSRVNTLIRVSLTALLLPTHKDRSRLRSYPNI